MLIRQSTTATALKQPSSLNGMTTRQPKPDQGDGEKLQKVLAHAGKMRVIKSFICSEKWVGKMLGAINFG